MPVRTEPVAAWFCLHQLRRLDKRSQIRNRARVFGALVMHLREIHLLTDISEITKVVSGQVKKKNDKADV